MVGTSTARDRYRHSLASTAARTDRGVVPRGVGDKITFGSVTAARIDREGLRKGGGSGSDHIQLEHQQNLVLPIPCRIGVVSAPDQPQFFRSPKREYDRYIQVHILDQPRDLQDRGDPRSVVVGTGREILIAL